MSKKIKRLFRQNILQPWGKCLKFLKKSYLGIYAKICGKKVDDKILESATNFFRENFHELDFECVKQKMLQQCDANDLIINLETPVTIQDKLNWIKLYDLDPLKSKCADKIEVHEYCKEKLGVDICVPILKYYDNVEEIHWDDLPDHFVMKCNHGSGMNIVISDKSKLNMQDVVKSLKTWMNTDYGLPYLELHYSKIPRKVLVEQYMQDEQQEDSLYDYKFWCFNGSPKYYTINDDHGHGYIIYYDVETDEIKDFYGILRHDKSILAKYRKPKNFEMMKMYAKKLSEDFKFVRVDFYEVNGKVYLGEMTFTPGGGMFRYKKLKDEIKMGKMLKLF